MPALQNAAKTPRRCRQDAGATDAALKTAALRINLRKMKRLFIALLFAMPAAAQVPAHTPHYPHISDMSAMYGAVSLELAGNRAGICTWVSNHFDYVVDYNANGGPVCENVNGQVYHLLYIESSDVTFISGQTTVYGIQTLAVSNSWILEQMFIHQSQDYSTGPGVQNWTQMDKFDNFDSANGVMTSVSGVFTDVSTQSYSGASNTTISDTLYVGYMEPFDQMNFVIATARVGGSVTWQYWNGSSWATLTLTTDGTSGLTATGQAYFHPPSNWAQTSVNSSNTKFFVRAVLSGQSTSPVYTTVKGDTWLTSGSNRGWSATCTGCINSGRLLYNASPPAGQTAHFLYQARSVNFANNYFFLNPNDSQGGKLTDAVYLESLKSGTSEGVMFDDAPNWPLDGRLANIIELSTDAAWVTAKNAVFDKIRADWHTSFGSNFLVGGNAQTHVSVCYHLDWCYAESTTYTPDAPQPEPANSFTAGQGPVFYDDMLTANNAANIPASEMCYDLAVGPNAGSFDTTYSTALHYWDRAQRGSITCLAQHYLAGNPNTGFSYHNQGSFNYNLTDEVYIYGPAITITSNITSGTRPATITLSSGASCTPFDYNGFGYLRVGTTTLGDTFYGQISGTTFTLSTGGPNISQQGYSSGNEAHCIQTVHQYTGAAPYAGNVYFWGTWFPAMAIDVGIPNASGLSGGARVMPYKTGGTPDYISGLAHSDCDNLSETGDFAGRCANLHRRDYTKAIVLYRDKKFPTKNVELDTLSQPIALGATYWPLRADGITSAGVSSIQLRGSEGAILMTAPIPYPVSYPGIFQ
jgi:hypothetical protein